MQLLIQSVSRSIDILTCVAHWPGPITLSDLARRVGLNATTAYNLASTLVARGFLTKRTSPAAYVLGPALGELLHAQRTDLQRRNQADALHELAEVLPEATLTVAEHHGGEIMIALRISPEQPGVLQEPRRAMPAYTSASALVFQAFWTEEQRQAYRRRYPFEEYGPSAWRSLKELSDFLARIRRERLAVLRRPGWKMLAVAAPFFSPGHEIEATIGAAGLVGGGSVEAMAGRLGKAVLAAAGKTCL